MGDRVENFLRIVRNTPLPSEELVETGAYPVRASGGGWTVPVERFEPVLDFYLRRSASLSPSSGKISSIFLSDFLTNEAGYPFVLADVEGLGGIYVGTTRALSFTFPAVQGASHAFVVDMDARVPFGFTPVWGALLAMAPTRAHFVSLLLGMPLPERTDEAFRRMSGEDLIFEIWKRLPDESFTAAIGEAITIAAARDYHFLMRRSVEDTRNGLLRFEKVPHFLKMLARSDGEGRGGALSSEEAYLRERRLFIEGRMTGVTADITSADMLPVFGAITALGGDVGLIYPSNIERWLWERYSEREGAGQIRDLYRHISTLSRIGASRTMIISSLELYPVVMPVADYLARVAHEESFDDLEVHQIYKLREIFVKLMRDEGNAALTPKEFLDLLARTICNVYGTMFRDAYHIAGDEPMDWEEFDGHMTRDSTAYRAIKTKLREKVKIYLMDAGVIAPPRVTALLPSGEIAAAAGPCRFRPGNAAHPAISPNALPPPIRTANVIAAQMFGIPKVRF